MGGVGGCRKSKRGTQTAASASNENNALGGRSDSVPRLSRGYMILSATRPVKRVMEYLLKQSKKNNKIWWVDIFNEKTHEQNCSRPNTGRSAGNPCDNDTTLQGKLKVVAKYVLQKLGRHRSKLHVVRPAILRTDSRSEAKNLEHGGLQVLHMDYIKKEIKWCIDDGSLLPHSFIGNIDGEANQYVDIVPGSVSIVQQHIDGLITEQQMQESIDRLDVRRVQLCPYEIIVMDSRLVHRGVEILSKEPMYRCFSYLISSELNMYRRDSSKRLYRQETWVLSTNHTNPAAAHRRPTELYITRTEALERWWDACV